MNFSFVEKYQISTIAVKGIWGRDQNMQFVINVKYTDKNKNKPHRAKETEEREETKASQTHKRQVKKRKEWTLLPQIYWPVWPKVQLSPTGLQFSPLPPSNPVISRDVWGQGESSSPRHFLCAETQRVQKHFRFKNWSHQLLGSFYREAKWN